MLSSTINFVKFMWDLGFGNPPIMDLHAKPYFRTRIQCVSLEMTLSAPTVDLAYIKEHLPFSTSAFRLEHEADEAQQSCNAHEAADNSDQLALQDELIIMRMPVIAFQVSIWSLRHY